MAFTSFNNSTTSKARLAGQRDQITPILC